MKKSFKSFIINKYFDGSRVDRFLKKKFPDVPQSLFEKNLRKKNITVNNKKVKNLFKLKVDDIVDVYTELKTKKTVRKKIFFSTNDFYELKKNFIFECEDYCILNMITAQAEALISTNNLLNLAGIQNKIMNFMNQGLLLIPVNTRIIIL